MTVWMICMTIFTVGFGDVSPKTATGKTMTIGVAVVGCFLISLSVVAVTNVFALTKEQEQAIKEIEYRYEAARLII